MKRIKANRGSQDEKHYQKALQAAERWRNNNPEYQGGVVLIWEGKGACRDKGKFHSLPF